MALMSLKDLGSLTTAIHAESRNPVTPITTPGTLNGSNFPVNLPDAPLIRLPQVTAEGRDLYDVMQDRRAVRAYSNDYISQEQLGTMLQIAAEGDNIDWPSQSYAARLNLLVVAWRVTGIHPGIYRYQLDSHALQLLMPPTDESLNGRGLVLQVEFAEAAALILITGSLRDTTAQLGSWGHRNLLVRAGAAGQRLWLASLSTGLCGTVFAGMLPRAARTLAGIDGFRTAGLFAYATGYPKTTGS